MLHGVGSDIADGAVELACRPNVLPRDFQGKLRESLEQSARRYAFEQLHYLRDVVVGLDPDEKVDVIRHDLQFMDHELVCFRNLAEQHLTRLFNERLVEYWSSVFGHEDHVVGQLSKAMAIMFEFHFCSI